MQTVGAKRKGKLYRTVSGYFGRLAVRPKREIGRNPDGSKQFSARFTLPIVRLGVEAGTLRAVGILDTRQFTQGQEFLAKKVFGDDWHQTLLGEVEALAKVHGMEEITSKSEIKLATRGATGPEVMAAARTMSAVRHTKARPPLVEDE